MNFHELRVSNVEENTKNSVKVTFEIPDNLKQNYQFEAGQHVALDFKIERNKYRRTYSICTAPHEKTLSISIKRQKNGIISNYINNGFFKGLRVQVSEPFGDFFKAEQLSEKPFVVLWAGGSGITVLLSIAKQILQKHQEKDVILVYANQNTQNIMFRNEIESLLTQFSDRFRVIHILSEPEKVDFEFKNLFKPKEIWTGKRGYIDEEFVKEIKWNYSEAVHYICGPTKMMQICEENLHKLGVKSVYSEHFAGATFENSNQNAVLKVNLKGKNQSVSTEKNSLLEAMLQANLEPPYACKSGTCGSCKAKLVQGEVVMARDFALNEDDRAKNKILCCQSWAKSDEIVIEF
jgi:ring-1,2-phenylacetyl-CoA epoxidase subunit PaaE